MLPSKGGHHMKQKHMTKEMRERIEKGIREGESLKEIANAISKDPTTISKEVLKHRSDVVPEYHLNFYAFCSRCSNISICKLRKVCDNQKCNDECRYCSKVDPTGKCRLFKKAICKRTNKFPYVCNGCPTRKRCRLQKYEYVPITAQRDYEKELRESRQGLNLTGDEFKKIDEVFKEGFENGQSINHIIANNPELKISVKTGYNYVNSGNFQVKHNNLPNYMNHILKKRKIISKDYEYQENRDMSRKGREYYDYLLYVDTNDIIYHGELDCVGITKDYVGALLTIIIPKWSFLLLFKLDIKDMAHVDECINFVYDAMGYEKFNKYLGVLLTDRGPEFNDYQGIEFDKDGVRRCRLFYCDSGQSTQKPFVERINREIRRYVFKGQSVESIAQDDCNLIASYINNMTLDGLGNKTPYEFAKRFLGEEILEKLNIKYIKPNDLIIKNIDMIKYELKKKSK